MMKQGKYYRDDSPTVAKCGVCGKILTGSIGFCFSRHIYICSECENRCPNFSKSSLPDGTHCKKSYRESVPDQVRALNRPFLALPSEVEKVKARLSRIPTDQLTEFYNETLNKYDGSSDVDDREKFRTNLAAVQKILKERKSRAGEIHEY